MTEAHSVNIAHRLTNWAQQAPERPAILQPVRTLWSRQPTYRSVTFSELDRQSDVIAAGLTRRGLQPGWKLVLFVPFSIEFISLTFGLFKAGAVVVLIDPGMGRRNIFRCLEEVRPDGFVAIPVVHLVRMFSGRLLRTTRMNVSVGPKLPGIAATLNELLRESAEEFSAVPTDRHDQAAVIFTSGSTGPPKGVLYEHGMFDAQVEMIQSRFNIEPGEVDLPGFPLFGLFNAAMGVTTVIPEMDPTRPAQVDPVKILAAIESQHVTQAFGSPAFWNRVGRYCEQHQVTLPGVKRALSAGGPVPIHVLSRMRKALTRAGADLFTPYGATESLPVASIGAKEILESTAALTRNGAGTCVGTAFDGVDVRIIPVTNGPIANIAETQFLDPGEIGEIIVRSRSVTREYYLRPEATALAKIPDGDRFWHRIGDVGYLDAQGKLWFCGRKAHIVQTADGPLYSVCCEAIFNEHPQIYRSALVGIGTAPNQRPALIAEPEAEAFPQNRAAQEQLLRELKKLGADHSLTRSIQNIYLHKSLPVDTRHNVKINRENLSRQITFLSRQPWFTEATEIS